MTKKLLWKCKLWVVTWGGWRDGSGKWVSRQVDWWVADRQRDLFWSTLWAFSLLRWGCHSRRSVKCLILLCLQLEVETWMTEPARFALPFPPLSSQNRAGFLLTRSGWPLTSLLRLSAFWLRSSVDDLSQTHGEIGFHRTFNSISKCSRESLGSIDWDIINQCSTRSQQRTHKTVLFHKTMYGRGVVFPTASACFWWR